MGSKQVADPRSEDELDPYYQRSLGDSGWIYEVIRFITVLPMDVFFRLRAQGLGNLPDGAYILAPNHFSAWDHFLIGRHIKKRRIRFMAKSQMFDKSTLPKKILTWVFMAGGAIPTKRGCGSRRGLEVALQLLGRGEVVLIYCEGTRQSYVIGDCPKKGVGALALESGLPVVPVAIHGSQFIGDVFKFKRWWLPKVTVRFGRPMHFDQTPNPTKEQQLGVAQEILAQIKREYAWLDD
jgi:1-acyl-sn-glycerol-3-phosphate acyltransferase